MPEPRCLKVPVSELARRQEGQAHHPHEPERRGDTPRGNRREVEELQEGRARRRVAVRPAQYEGDLPSGGDQDPSDGRGNVQQAYTRDHSHLISERTFFEGRGVLRFTKAAGHTVVIWVAFLIVHIEMPDGKVIVHDHKQEHASET